MVFTFRINKVKKEQSMIDTQEAFNLWDILSSKYQAVEKLQVFEHLAHDLDLKLLIVAYLRAIKKDIKIVEQQMEKFSIRTPREYIVAVNQPVNQEIFYDQQIANEIFLYKQENVENLLRALRSTTTNDSVREIIQNMAVDTVNRADKILVYLKLKGWIQTPPLYQDIPKDLDEKLTTAEAYHMWDFLSVRYDNIHQTQTFLSFAFDGDFRKALQTGISLLEKQAEVLEKELNYFGIPLPQKPSKIAVNADNTELMDDDHMYRITLIGLQGASIIHAQAFKQCTFNDRLRSIFKKIILDEISYQGKLYKFGKLKGWLHSVPSYRET